MTAQIGSQQRLLDGDVIIYFILIIFLPVKV